MDTVIALFKHLPRLKSRKSPMWALVVGILFGCVGCGIYFRSLTDLVILLILAIVVVPTMGLGYPVVAVLTGLYSYCRAAESNERRG